MSTGRPTSYMFITLVRGGHTSIASTPKRWISSTAFVAIERRIVEQALRLNGALLELPFRSGLHIIEAGWNILEVYKGALTAQRVDARRRRVRIPVRLVRGRVDVVGRVAGRRWSGGATGRARTYLKSGIPSGIVRMEAATPAACTGRPDAVARRPLLLVACIG